VRSLGIVDIGSNTARLVVYEYEPGRWFRLVDDIREPIRLGESLWRTGALQESAIRRAQATLELFADYAAAASLDHFKVIATSAVRDADNRDAFFERLEPLGLDLQVLEGEEEARLGVSAVANGFDLTEAWVVDVGGGSAQISRMRDRDFDGGAAFPLGAVRLTEDFLRSDPLRARDVAALEKRVGKVLEQEVAKLRSDRAPLVAMGGSVRNLAHQVQLDQQYPFEILHGYWLARPALEALVDKLVARTLRARMAMSGISSARADVIVAPALLFRWLLRESGREGLWISGYGMREGFFFRHFLPPPHRLESVRRFSVENLLRAATQPRAHVEHVRYLALRLFDGLAPLHGLERREREVLDAAAMLHDIGATISYFYHHEHGAYWLRSAALPGYSHREQALITLLVRYHHKGSPKVEGFGSILDTSDRQVLLKLTVCLRLAEYLERSRAQRIRDVEVEIGKRRVVLRLQTDDDPTVEIWETQKHGALFRRALGRELRLERA
jgi:exopolyphosphatase/guanosine-5'-triphosphate,3'-diphosphate pyrophosphatase